MQNGIIVELLESYKDIVYTKRISLKNKLNQYLEIHHLHERILTTYSFPIILRNNVAIIKQINYRHAIEQSRLLVSCWESISTVSSFFCLIGLLHFFISHITYSLKTHFQLMSHSKLLTCWDIKFQIKMLGLYHHLMIEKFHSK